MALAGSLPTPFALSPVVASVATSSTPAKLSSVSTAQTWVRFSVQNPHATESIWIGPSDVSNAGARLGLEVLPRTSVTIDASDASLWYVVSDGTAGVAVVLGMVT